MTFLILTVLVGTFTPLQTAVNARLSNLTGNAVVASFLSFVISTAILAAMFFITGEQESCNFSNLSAIPWWAWTGGVFGAFYVAGIIMLFRHIGSVQSIVLPIFGQIILSLVIDAYGLFGMPLVEPTLQRIAGVTLVFAGVIMIVALPGIKSARKQYSKNMQLYQIGGVILGCILTMNSVANGKLGVSLDSPLAASALSFAIGTVILGLLSLKGLARLKDSMAKEKNIKWWIFMGGPFGAAIVFGCSWLIPVTGAGTLAVLTLLGQMAVSLVIDKYGLFMAEKKKISPVQLFGILIMMAGVAIINFWQS